MNHPQFLQLFNSIGIDQVGTALHVVRPKKGKKSHYFLMNVEVKGLSFHVNDKNDELRDALERGTQLQIRSEIRKDKKGIEVAVYFYQHKLGVLDFVIKSEKQKILDELNARVKLKVVITTLDFGIGHLSIQILKPF